MPGCRRPRIDALRFPPLNGILAEASRCVQAYPRALGRVTQSRECDPTRSCVALPSSSWKDVRSFYRNLSKLDHGRTSIRARFICISGFFFQIFSRLYFSSIAGSRILPFREIEIGFVEDCQYILHTESLVVCDRQAKNRRQRIEERAESDCPKYYRRRIAEKFRFVFA